jgi:hypothetical protein
VDAILPHPEVAENILISIIRAVTTAPAAWVGVVVATMAVAVGHVVAAVRIPQPASAASTASMDAAAPKRRVACLTCDHMPNCGGPQILNLEEMTQAYLRIRARNSTIRQEELVTDELLTVFRSGINLVPDHAVGTVTWEAFLGRRYGQAHQDETLTG